MELLLHYGTDITPKMKNKANQLKKKGYPGLYNLFETYLAPKRLEKFLSQEYEPVDMP